MFAIASIIVTLAALFSFVNRRYLRMPPTVGVMLLAMIASLGIALLGGIDGGVIRHHVSDLIGGIDFNKTLLHGALAFLLFAGALHLDLGDLKRQWLVVMLLSLLGTAVSTLAVGAGMFYALAWMGMGLPWIACLLFGALISPTDPVAILGIVQSAGAPRELQTQIVAESLFNDGVGVVLFLTLLTLATGSQTPTVGSTAALLARQAVGGGLVGLTTGFIAFEFLRRIDEYKVEVLITLALAMGGYSLADAFGVSAPIATVVAGLLIGNQGRAFAMSRITIERLDIFWELIDDILNVVIFMLVGMEMLIMFFRPAFLLAGTAAIIVSLLARWVSVTGIIGTLRGTGMPFCRGTIRILTWGGLRGGLALAMALALPPRGDRDLLLATTYCVVVFSVLVQGLTFRPLVRRYCRGGAVEMPVG